MFMIGSLRFDALAAARNRMLDPELWSRDLSILEVRYAGVNYTAV
jgi:hypothetical protein